MFVEIHLVPKCCTPRGLQRMKVIEALAPSRTMIPKALTISARRLDARLWEAWYVPLRWWKLAPIIPAIEQNLFWRDNRGESIYQWVRCTEVVCANSNPSTRDLGPDVRVIAADRLTDDSRTRAAQVWKATRRIFYLDASNPRDGLYQPHPDATCVSPRGHRSRCPEVDEQSLEYAAKQCAAYVAEIEAPTKGLVKNSVGAWITPEQFAAEQQYAAEQSAFERHAHGG